MTIPESGQGPPSGEDMSGLFAEFEAAGCVGEDITDPFQCYRDAIDSGLIKDPAGAGNHIGNMIQACKRGGVGSCREFMKTALRTDMGCQAEKIAQWAPNISCDCDTMKCVEITPLSWQERRALQLGAAVATPTEATVGNAKLPGPTWAWVAGAGVAAWLIFGRK